MGAPLSVSRNFLVHVHKEENPPSFCMLFKCLSFALAMLAITLACTFSLTFIQPIKAYALEDLNVYVGYAGGPYYLKASFTAEELEALADDTLYTYTGVDNGYFLNKFIAQGIPLDKLFNNYTASKDITGNNAGVNTNSLWRIFFATTSEEDRYNQLGFDGTGNEAWYWGRYKNHESRSLDINQTPRYYYTNYPLYFNFDTKQIYVDENGSKESIISDSGVTVPSLLAIRYVKERVKSIASWEAMDETYTTVSSLPRTDNRLIFGQTSPTDKDVTNSVHDIAAIYCVYSGRPTVSIAENDELEALKGRIGETITLHASITSADPLISTKGVEDIVWSSSDTSIAKVVSNGDGSAKVTIVGKGDVKITATFGNSSYEEFVSSTSATVSGPGGSGWRGEDEGTGWNYGEGDGEQGPGAGGNNGSGNANTDNELTNPGNGDVDQAGTEEGEPDGGNDVSGETDKISAGTDAEGVADAGAGDEPKELSKKDMIPISLSSGTSLKEAKETVAGAGGNSSASKGDDKQETSGGSEIDDTEEEDPESTEVEEDYEELPEEVLQELAEQEEVEEDTYTTAYKLNLEEVETQETATDTTPLPKGVIALMLTVCALGGLCEAVFYRRSLDKSVPSNKKGRIWTISKAS